MIGNNETNFHHNLLLTDKQISRLLQTNHLLMQNYKKLSKKLQSEGFFGRLLGQLMNFGLPLMKNVFPHLIKSLLISLGLTAAVSAAYAGIHKKSLRFRISGPGKRTLKI